MAKVVFKGKLCLTSAKVLFSNERMTYICDAHSAVFYAHICADIAIAQHFFFIRGDAKTKEGLVVFLNTISDGVDIWQNSLEPE